MQQSLRILLAVCVCSLVLTGTSARGASLPYRPGRHEAQDRDDREHKRVYDREHKDWHDWDEREERAYRYWLSERHERYVEHERLERARQAEYWRWRHERLDWNGGLRVYDWDHRDWHDWDDREERAYRHWLVEERHERYVEYERLHRPRQIAYWHWRHLHVEWER